MNWKSATCVKCSHGLLQHRIESGPIKEAVKLQGVVLLRNLYEWVRLGRLASARYRSSLWTNLCFEGIEEIVKKKKSLLARGGSQSNDTRMDTTRLILELHTLATSGTQFLRTTDRASIPVRMAIVFDKMYFQLYYAALTTFGRSTVCVPGPGQHFAIFQRHIQDALEVITAFCSEESIDKIPEGWTDLIKLSAKKNTFTCELLTVHQFRMLETVLFFYGKGIGMNGEMDTALATSSNLQNVVVRLSKRAKKKKARSGTSSSNASSSSSALEPRPAYPLLQAWRDNCRDFCCHLFAYATPNEKALKTLKKYQPIMEVGAGTGYWCALAQQMNINMHAVDKAPPQSEGKYKNEFHANVPPFCEVRNFLSKVEFLT